MNSITDILGGLITLIILLAVIFFIVKVSIDGPIGRIPPRPLGKSYDSSRGPNALSADKIIVYMTQYTDGEIYIYTALGEVRMKKLPLIRLHSRDLIRIQYTFPRSEIIRIETDYGINSQYVSLVGSLEGRQTFILAAHFRQHAYEMI